MPGQSDASGMFGMTIASGIIIKCTLHKVIVQSMLLYARGTWALPKQQTHRLDVFQIKCLKQICKDLPSWAHAVSQVSQIT